MAVDIVIQETIDLVDITVNPNIIEVNVTRTSGGGNQTLAQTLVLGNATGGTNILVNNADAIELENTSKLSKGVRTESGAGGIALTCAVGYEWKWEAGEAYLTNLSGNFIDAKQYARSVPTPTDDDTKGFYAGSEWFTLTGVRYQCLSATTGDASWQLVSTIPNLEQVLNVGDRIFKLKPGNYTIEAEDIYSYVAMQEASPGDGTIINIDNDIFNKENGVCLFSVFQGDGVIQFSGVGTIANNGVEGLTTLAYNQGDVISIKYVGAEVYYVDIVNKASGGGSGTVTSVGLTMPSAFTVTNSPITSSGDIAVTGAGAVSQYVRGDGSLANFPTSSGGGSSLSFYLNGSVSQGTFGGVAFKEMDRTPILGAGTDFTINANGYIQSFITDAGVPNQLEIPAGNWNFETYFSASSNGGSPSFYVELYKWDGATLSLIASSSATPENITGGTSIDLYVSALAVPQTALLATDRLAVRIYVTHSGRTITLHTEDNHLCQVITTFSTGLTALNGLTAQVQNLATGTSGTDFGINSTTATHTFNLPTASASNRGALSSSDWTTFNDKQNTSTLLVDSIDKAILRNNYFWFLPNTVTNGVASSFGYSERLSSAFVLLLNGNLLRGMVTFSTTAIAGTIASMRQNNSLSITGYECKFTRKIQFNSNVSGQRFFCGISKGNQFAIATNVEPNTLTDIVGVCQLSTSTNMHIVYNDASGVATTSDLGTSYPCNDSQYNYYITVEQTTTSYIITVERVTVSTGASISTSLTTSTNIPNYATGVIQLFTFITNNATASIASYLDGGAIGSFKN
jgi:hypothetical protein